MINLQRGVHISYKNPNYEPAKSIRNKIKENEKEGIQIVSMLIPNFRYMQAYGYGFQSHKNISNLQNIKTTNKGWVYYDKKTGSVKNLTNNELTKQHGRELNQLLSNKMGEDVKLNNADLKKTTRNATRFINKFGSKKYNNAIELENGMLYPAKNAKDFLSQLDDFSQNTPEIEEVEEIEEEKKPFSSSMIRQGSRFSILSQDDD